MAARTFVDQLGNAVVVPHPPQRIVSLVPSQTELLASLGLNAEVIGITKFCVHPQDWRKTKTLVGGTKNFRVDLIRQLQPDLVIGNKEENEQESINELMALFPVWLSDIATHQDALSMIRLLGELTGKHKEANQLIGQIENAFNDVDKFPDTPAIYLIWKNPWMGAASNTFIHHMMELAGLKNCLGAFNRYPKLTEDMMRHLNPGVVLLSSEPYPFKEAHMHELRAILPRAKMVMVDGEMFSWYGSRMLMFPDYISRLKTQLS
jgi:ABC-type Fe3+-hydroxamate transport system substrate-binding protein